MLADAMFWVNHRVTLASKAQGINNSWIMSFEFYVKWWHQHDYKNSQLKISEFEIKFKKNVLIMIYYLSIDGMTSILKNQICVTRTKKPLNVIRVSIKQWFKKNIWIFINIVSNVFFYYFFLFFLTKLNIHHFFG